MSRTWLGIDPGKDGALVVVDDHGNVASQVKTRSLLVEGEYVPELMADTLRSMVVEYQLAGAALELCAGRPWEGRGSLMTVGKGWGLWRGMLAAFAVRTVVPSSNRWTRMLHDVQGEGKARAVAFAASRLPGLELVGPRCRTPHSGLADAACLALYARAELAGTAVALVS